ncbi:hypothetical protein HK105_203329 [Polyrhizophydium stewartii]|uniref:Ubiquitin-like domain-containing protein n=1 Tax=Polyrhizophydium stewartii TaxID=2732419 RepID=A0ABR4NCP1_9FUNG
MVLFTVEADPELLQAPPPDIKSLGDGPRLFKAKATSTVKTVKRHLSKLIGLNAHAGIVLTFRKQCLGDEWTLEYVSRTMSADDGDPMALRYSFAPQL